MPAATLLDERDTAILSERAAAFDLDAGPRVGDWVDFADGVTRRISHDWGADCDDLPLGSIQTSDSGSFYLGHGYVSFSGSLYQPVKRGTLTLADETRPGRVWFFHHDHARAGNGVDTELEFRVYACSESAPQ